MAGALSLLTVIPVAAAWRTYPESPLDTTPGMDLAQLKVWNGNRDLHLRLTWYDLRRARLGEVYFAIDTAPVYRKTYAFRLRWSPQRQHFVGTFGRQDVWAREPSNVAAIGCRSLQWTWTFRPALDTSQPPTPGLGDTIDVRVPQRCFGEDAGTVWITATTIRRDGGKGDHAPETWELGGQDYIAEAIERG
jgi:hypothetical protein